MIFPKYSGTPLKIHDKGKEVLQIQSAINVMLAKYPVCDAITEDGVFGKETKTAVCEVQNLFGLQSDGIVTDKEWNGTFAISNIVTEPY